METSFETFHATVTEPNGTTFYLGRRGWYADRHHQGVIEFATKGDAYRTYQKAFKRKGDVYRAVPSDRMVLS